MRVAGLEALVKEVTSTADRLSLENEKIKMTLDQNKMVNQLVVGGSFWGFGAEAGGPSIPVHGPIVFAA